MELQKLVIRSGEDVISVDGEKVSRSALLDQLERMVESRHFRNSKRYPVFLRFVVEQTLAGSLESLKERNLGIEVFARPVDYDTNADPIVRVTAGEVRKRIAQYYQEAGRERELHIDLPLGTYVPQFRSHAAPSHEPPSQEPGLALESMAEPLRPDLVSVAIPITAEKPKDVGRYRLLLASGVIGVLVLLVLAWWLHARQGEAGVRSLWQASLSSAAPATIIIGVHSLDRAGKEELVESHAIAKSKMHEPVDMLSTMVRSDMVPISDVVSYSRVTDLLNSHTHAYTTMGSADATLEEVRRGPVVLIGGLDNLWTLRMTARLRFGFASVNGLAGSEIIDHQHPATVWRFDNLQQAIVNTRDYAIVASYFDSTIDQPVLILAGIGKAGTQVAAEFATSNQDLLAWLQQGGKGAHKNVEIVLSTEILDGKPGPPKVVTSATW